MGVTYEREGRIATITVSRREALNSLDPESLQELSEASLAFRDDAEAWVGIVTGTGERAFCAGADLRTTIPLYGDRSRRPAWQAPPTIMRGVETWKPLIAAVNGMALGGGCELALACDLVVAADNATFGQPEVGWGLMPGWGATQRLIRRLPYQKAAEMVFIGATIDAQEALRIGLVNLVVPKGELMATARSWADAICGKGPLAVRAAKEAMLRGLALNLQDGLRLEEALFDTLRYTDDFQEGPRAFSERRKPEFRGQ